MMTDSDLLKYETAEENSDGSVVVVSTRFKTRGKYGRDPILIRKELRPLIQFYIENIRPELWKRYQLFPHTKRVVKFQSERALLLNERGERIERYDAFPQIMEKLIGKRITVTTWRKIISTESAQKCTERGRVVLAQLNTHDPRTAAQHYQLLNERSLAMEGANILNGLANPNLPPTPIADLQRTPTAASVVSPLSASLSSSSSSSIASPLATVTSTAVPEVDTSGDDELLRGLFVVRKKGPQKKRANKSAASDSTDDDSTADSEPASRSKKKKTRRSTKPKPKRSVESEEEDEKKESDEESQDEDCFDSDSDIENSDDEIDDIKAPTAASRSTPVTPSVPRSTEPIASSSSAVSSSNAASMTIDDDSDEDIPLCLRNNPTVPANSAATSELASALRAAGNRRLTVPPPQPPPPPPIVHSLSIVHSSTSPPPQPRKRKRIIMDDEEVEASSVIAQSDSSAGMYMRLYCVNHVNQSFQSLCCDSLCCRYVPNS